MFSVDSKVTFDFGKLNALDANAVTAFKMTADAFLTELENGQVMPFDTGNLQNESTFVDDSGAQNGVIVISSSTPYARRLYYHPEYNFNQEFNQAAGGGWFKYWLPGGTRQNFCVEAFKTIYRRLCGL